MKKILIFGYTLEMGGAEKALVDTINFLSDKCEIDLYLLEKKGSLLSDIPENVNIYQMKNNIFSYILFRFIPIVRKLRINKIASKKDYFAALGYMEGRSGTWVADIKKKIKKYAWIHNDVLKFDIGISDKEAIDTYNKVDKVICVSKESKINFCKKYQIDKKKVEVIYNYINEEEIIKKSIEFKVKNDKLTFVNVAAMRDQKRQDRLVMAAKKLKDEGYDFKIQLVGGGQNLEKIKEMIYTYKVQDNVEMLGEQKNPYPYIKNSDFFILSSYMEGYGIVVKEALFLGKKVITTDVVGPREILEDGKYGIIVPNTDEAVYDILKEIINNPHKYDYLDKNISNYKGDNEEIKNKVLKLLDLDKE